MVKAGNDIKIKQIVFRSLCGIFGSGENDKLENSYSVIKWSGFRSKNERNLNQHGKSLEVLSLQEGKLQLKILESLGDIVAERIVCMCVCVKLFSLTKE